MKAQVHAPYHFVPLSKWVYLPEWAHLVSHDHPFSDGLSGVITVDLTNKTPLLVGSESSKQTNSPTLVKWTRTPDGKFVIPGSSLKGMLRSFLEVATFAKFKQIDDNRYAYRDISRADTDYSVILQNTHDQAAWLSFNSEENKWQYRKCKHTRLYGKDINSFLKSKNINATISNNQSNQSILDKYKILPLNEKEITFEHGEYLTEKSKPRDCAIRIGQGKSIGVPVFVGYRPGKSKDLDFNYMFYDASNEATCIKDDKLVNQMFSAHDEELINYLKANGHPELGIPIFIRAKTDKNKNFEENDIKAIGLAKMPKMLYKHSVSDLANKQQKNVINNDAAFDMCELMFGTLRDYGIGLKSRVSFSDSICINQAKLYESSPVILGQPKASYANAYLEQQHNDGDVKGNLSSYDDNAQLSGWKRYPTQSRFNNHLPSDLADKKNVQSKLELLEPGAQFSGKIVFHNLKPMELGALLWAISPSDDFYHGLGHGKSLGAGAVQLNAQLELAYINQGIELDANSLIDDFIKHMKNNYLEQNPSNDTWTSSSQIQHLLAFGNMTDNEGKNLTYMPLQKNAAPVTYSNSKAGRSAKALPNWQVEGKNISRSENLTSSNEYLPKGRLSELVQSLVDDKHIRESIEVAKAKNEEELKNQEIQARKDAASELFKQFLELLDVFEVYRGKDSQDAENQVTARHADITKILQQVVAGDSDITNDEIKQLYDSLMDFELTRYFNEQTKMKDLSKKQKERHREKMELLEKISTLCN